MAAGALFAAGTSSLLLFAVLALFLFSDAMAATDRTTIATNNAKMWRELRIMSILLLLCFVKCTVTFFLITVLLISRKGISFHSKARGPSVCSLDDNA